MPSASSVTALRATMLLIALALLPERCPSTTTNDRPPPGRSIISIVSPLSGVAYLRVLATATSKCMLWDTDEHRCTRIFSGVLPFEQDGPPKVCEYESVFIRVQRFPG